MDKLFGTDGIRGKANQYPMDGPTAFRVGQAIVTVLKRDNPDVRIVIGRDTRISGDMLENALASGVASMGGEVLFAGVLPTPAISFFTVKIEADAGVVISASHNPFEDNGIKIFGKDGFKLSDEQESVIERLVLEDDFSEFMPLSENLGRIRNLPGSLDQYVAFLREHFPENLSLGGMKIVLDTANGATYAAAPLLFEALDIDVSVIHDQPNGTNINDRCGSQHTEDLEAEVLKRKADAGFAFDGDGDRLIAVDETGTRLTGDQILLICARSLKEKGQLKNNLLVSTVMSNLGLARACRKNDIERRESPVGDRYVLEDMQAHGAVLGGEESGHIILLNHHTTSDGIITASELLTAMAENKQMLSELAGLMTVYPQKLMNVPVREKPDVLSVPELAKAIRQAESELGDEGRVLVRYSGTQRLCRVMVEGSTMAVTEKYCRQIADRVRETLG